MQQSSGETLSWVWLIGVGTWMIGSFIIATFGNTPTATSPVNPGLPLSPPISLPFPSPACLTPTCGVFYAMGQDNPSGATAKVAIDGVAGKVMPSVVRT